MKRKFLLFLSVMLVALLPLCASAKVVRVVKSTVPWPTVYIHYWGDAASTWESCPAMEADGDEYLKYDIGDNSNFLLKSATGNGGTQTGNMENVCGDVIVKITNNTIEQVVSGPDVITYAIRGDFTKTGWSDFLLEGEGDELSVKITPTTGTSGSFGIRTIKNNIAQRDKWFGGNVSISESNSEVTLISAENSKWNLTLNREYTFTYNITTKKLTITWEGGDEPVAKPSIYIFGQIDKGEWQTNVGYELKNIAGTDRYYCNNIKTKDSETDCFLSITTKLMSTSDDWRINNYRYSVEGRDATALGTFTITSRTDNNDSFKVKSGTYYAIVDMAAMTIEIGDAAEHLKSINAPEALYMYGNFWDRHFDFSDPVVAVGEPSTEGDHMTYKFENILIVGATEEGESGYFILGAGKAPANNAALFAETAPQPVAPAKFDWTGIAGTHRYVLGENNVITPLVANAHPTTAENCSSVEAGKFVDLNVTLAADGNHTYEITTHDVSTGVEAIEAETNAPVEYYNLQGVRVANPENGIFIRRQGNKVSKVAIR